MDLGSSSGDGTAAAAHASPSAKHTRANPNGKGRDVRHGSSHVDRAESLLIDQSSDQASPQLRLFTPATSAPTPDSRPATASTSSGDDIVFTGRGNAVRSVVHQPPLVQRGDAVDASAEVEDDDAPPVVDGEHGPATRAAELLVVVDAAANDDDDDDDSHHVDEDDDDYEDVDDDEDDDDENDEDDDYLDSVERELARLHGKQPSKDDGDDDAEDDDYLEEVERELERQHKERLSDETIARLLAKQESLGIQSEDLELFDGMEDLDMPERLRGPPPAFMASSLAGGGHGDDYGAFDVTDRERTSITWATGGSSRARRGRGRHGAQGGARGLAALLDLDDIEGLDRDDLDALDDSDPFVAQLQEVWEKDRRAKRAKRVEREEQRAQGLLGRGGGGKRYGNVPAGDLYAQLEAFLADGAALQTALPPMEKAERKTVHDVANILQLTSKSQGARRKRFIVLYKTSRTASALTDWQRALLRDRVLGDAKGRRGKPRGAARARSPAAGLRRRGGGFDGATTAREGEVIGAAAPELSQESKGRKMMEKMGWSTGTALGMEGQGILEPIRHVVRNSRAGLG